MEYMYIHKSMTQWDAVLTEGPRIIYIYIYIYIFQSGRKYVLYTPQKVAGMWIPIGGRCASFEYEEAGAT